MTFGRGRKAPGGRSKRMRPRRERRRAHGEVSVVVRRPAARRTAARPPLDGRDRAADRRRLLDGRDEDRRRDVVRQVRDEHARARVQPAPASHSPNGRSSTSPWTDARRRRPPPSSRASASARSGSISTATTPRGARGERPRQRAVARPDLEDVSSGAEARRVDDALGGLGLREEVLAPALAGGNAGLSRAGPPVMLWRHGVA